MAPSPTQANRAAEKSAEGSMSLFYRAALVGLGLGIALAYLAGHNVLSPHSGGTIGLLLLGLPAAAVFLGMMHRWIKQGDLPVSVPAIGLLVLGVNLLAAGAAGFPGVAQTAWILIPVTLGLASSPIKNRSPRWIGMALAACSALLAVSCYLTGYAPVLYSQDRLSDAEVPFQSSENVRSDLVAAAAADPWAAEPWERLGELHLELWLQRKADHALAAEDRAEFARAAKEYARREVPSYRVSQRQASWHLRLYARS